MSSQNFILNILFKIPPSSVGLVLFSCCKGNSNGQSEQDVEFVEPPKKRKGLSSSPPQKRNKKRPTGAPYLDILQKEGGCRR